MINSLDEQADADTAERATAFDITRHQILCEELKAFCPWLLI